MLHKLKRIDGIIVTLLLLLMTLSIFIVYSATIDDSFINVSVWKSVTFCLIGIAAFLVVSLIDYRWLLKWIWYPYGVATVLLVLVMKFASKINGATGWFSLPGGLQFQPAELMKLVLILALAHWLGRRQGEPLGLARDLFPAGIITFLPFVIVLMHPDLGNAIIYIVILVGILWIANIRISHALAITLIIGGILFTGIYIYVQFHDQINDFLNPILKEVGISHWLQRIDSFLFPDKASHNASFQSVNAIQAIGSGGLTGEGYLQGTSIHSNFIPLAYSDSIFVIIGEEFGFRGSALLLILYFVLIYRMILIAIQCKNKAGSYLVIGVVSMFVFQIFQNIGMMIGVMPITGITLPFISYGGTSLMINMLSMGLVMSVQLHPTRLGDEEYMGD